MRLARPVVPLAWRRPARWAALLAGAVPTLAFPAPALSVVAWFALVPGLLIIRRAPSAREAAVRGWWLGSGYIVAAMYWLGPGKRPGGVLVAGGCRALAALIGVPTCWLLGEWLRAWQALGVPWGVLGPSQWRHPAVLALAAVG